MIDSSLVKLYSSSSIFTMNKISKQLYISMLIFLLAITISGPIFHIDDRYLGNQLIQHPITITKNSNMTLLNEDNYVVIMDGGSTGTRIHIFTFEIDNIRRQQRIRLKSEHFYHTQPGISSFATNFTDLNENLQKLVRKALRIVPDHQKDQTPLLLKATAGLRLLPPQKAADIIDHLRSYFRANLPFKIDDNSIDMLSETDEGLFAWYTVNFLQEKLHKINESIITLDLGGGSTQITFSTYNLNTIIRSNQYIVQRNIEGEQEFLYTHSYLGLGLMAARRSILSLMMTMASNESNSNDFNAFKSNGGDNLDDRREFRVKSSCFKILNNQTYDWKHDDTIYHIEYEPSNGNNDDWYNCLKYVQKFIADSDIDQPEELRSNHRQIYAISYFYDRIKDIRLIKHGQHSATIRVGDFFYYSQNICNGTIRFRRQNIFLCMDLTYISVYLHHGLGIPLSTDIVLMKKIFGYEISWALGAAINLFQR